LSCTLHSAESDKYFFAKKFVMKKLFTTLCVALSLHGFSRVYRVPSDYPTIQSALNAAKTGDTVLVSPGMYKENLLWPAVNNLHLIGTDSKNLSAIIDGNAIGRVIEIKGGGLSGFKAEINSLTIENGYINVPAHQGGRGAGIFASNAAISVVNCLLAKNIITTNTAIQNSGGGAAIHFEATPVGLTNLIDSCRIVSNSISEVTNGSGSAIKLDNATSKVEHTIINRNKMSVEEVGVGTLYAYESPLKINDVKIEGNRISTNENILQGAAAIKGGGIFSFLSNTVIENLLADNNILTPFNTGLALLGSGVYYYGSGNGLKMSNSTIANNKRTDGAPVNGTGIYFSSSDGKGATIFNSILWNVDNGPEVYNQTKKSNIF
jgi:hypothetical protein